MSAMDPDLGVLEYQLHQARQNAIKGELNAAGLGEIGHPMLLCILRRVGDVCPGGRGQTQRELAQQLNISPAAVTASLKSLEGKGYIRREPEPGDARCNRVQLTEKGQRAVEDCMACLQRVSRRMYADFSTQDQATIQAFYLRILENLKHPPVAWRQDCHQEG